MSKRALITGVAGQDGTYLSELLAGKGYDVFGLVRTCERESAEQSCGPLGVNLIDGDLTDKQSLLAAVQASRPDEVYNLAGQSAVGLSWNEPTLTAEVNSVGVARLLEVLRVAAPEARFFQASSAEIFGNAEQPLQDEHTPIRPVTPYGSSKAYAHLLVQNVRNGWGMFACSGILYNHESPLRPTSFVTRKITDGVARIKLGLASELRLGNLDAARDWGFAGDYVEAMWLMLQAESPDDYVVASGEAHTVRDFCEVAFARVGLDWEDFVVVDSEFFRPVDRQAPAGDASKARDILGWIPKSTFSGLVAMMVDADMERFTMLQREG
ncbi:MAG: GDP-mannose 4,6-dehydratase [Coriobacteriia bacterium]